MRWSLVAAVLFIGWTVQKDGAEDAFGGAFSFLAPTPAEEILDETFLYADTDPRSDQGSATAARKVPITHAVRERVATSMKLETQRHQ